MWNEITKISLQGTAAGTGFEILLMVSLSLLKDFLKVLKVCEIMTDGSFGKKMFAFCFHNCNTANLKAVILLKGLISMFYWFGGLSYSANTVGSLGKGRYIFYETFPLSRVSSI
jgi:hypothetical protein